MSELTPKRI